MFDSHFSRVVIVNLISALIITFVACYFLMTFHLTDVLHVANIFGLYFLVIFGIDILVESGDVKNNHERFLIAIALIIIYVAIFLIFVPLIFGSDFLKLSDYLIFVFDGVRFDLTLNVGIYLIIFAVIMLIFNFLLYLKDKEKYGVE